MNANSESESKSDMHDQPDIDGENEKQQLLQVKIDDTPSKHHGFRSRLQQRMRQRFRRQKIGEERLITASSSVNKLIENEKKERETYEEEERKRKADERKKAQLEKLRQKRLQQAEEAQEAERKRKEEAEALAKSMLPPTPPPPPPGLDEFRDDDSMPSDYNPDDYEFEVQIIRAAWYIRLGHKLKLLYHFAIAMLINFMEIIGKVIRKVVLYFRGIQCMCMT